MSVRILLADDHEIVRRGLKELLEEQIGWTVCAEAANGRDAVDLAVQTRPQVAVLDFSMPELNGLEATRRIREVCPETEILVFTMHDSEELIREVLSAGARLPREIRRYAAAHPGDRSSRAPQALLLGTRVGGGA